MARMHTRKRGRSKSRKTATQLPRWVDARKDEVSALVEKLYKEGKTEAAIGSALRDEHGVPSAKLVLGKGLKDHLKEKKLLGDYPSDLLDLIRKAVRLRKHLKVNNKDVGNKAKLANIEAKIKRLVRYYRGKRLPKDWAYDADKAALLVK
jgi:small subunit ribosomal protein S15